MKPKAETVEYLTGLGRLINAYEEIAARRMQKIRKSVLKNREFWSDLNRTFQIVKTSYQKQVADLKIKQTGVTNGKTILVLLTANAGFYGDIIQRTFELFRSDWQKQKQEALVIGQVGKALVEQAGLTGPISYFDFPDHQFDPLAAQKLASKLLPYQTVVVYHGSFKNILMQETTASNITGETPPPLPVIPHKRLIFEPSLEEVLNFFETEIFTSLLFQSLYEELLAKFSCRMATLSEAEEKVRQAARLALLEREREKHRLANKKQLGMLTSRFLWQK